MLHIYVAIMSDSHLSVIKIIITTSCKILCMVEGNHNIVLTKSFPTLMN